MTDARSAATRRALRGAAVAVVSGLAVAMVAFAGARTATPAVEKAYLASLAQDTAHDVDSATAVALAAPAVAHDLRGGSGLGVLVSLVRSAPITSELRDVEAYPAPSGTPQASARLVPSRPGSRAGPERIEVSAPVGAGGRVLAVVRVQVPARPLERSVGVEVDRIDWILAPAAAGLWLAALRVVTRRRRLSARTHHPLEGVHGLLEPVLHP